MESWGLPPHVIAGVRECRRPETAADEPLLALVLWTGGWVATELGLGLESPEDARNLWKSGLTEHMRTELHELGYAKMLEYLIQSGDFVREVRQLGRLVAGRPRPMVRALRRLSWR